jgi:hypothetical protein
VPPVPFTINYDSFFTSTITKYEKTLQKNFLETRPSVRLLFDQFRHTDSGGYQIQIPVEYGNNSNTKFFNPYDSANTDPSEFSLPAIYPWRHVVSAATVSDIEQVANSGKEKLFDLFEGRLRQCVRSTVNLIGSEIYSDGTNFGGNTIVGLAAGIATVPASDPASGAVGGIPAAANVFWRNNSTPALGSFAVNGVNGSASDGIETMFNTCTDGMADRPNAFLSAQNVYEFYNKSLLGTVRYVTPEALQVGDFAFGGLQYKGVPWYWDRQCPNGRMYFINTKYVHFYVDPMMLFTWTEPRAWPNQLTNTRLMTLRCALVYKSRMFNGVVDGITA